ncbi:hypothetical protein D9619_005042 [Psilocybe cf. subviscida]|uniref:SPX domain-containing protein n=1 Tax=Psilocybe cf. subviscida TaxID=2480587 RepID=A0A8H5F7S9_9AGAR|nr:hypothetical protein D9619_005042 [Psilocybe cf. subviscida]
MVRDIFNQVSGVLHHRLAERNASLESIPLVQLPRRRPQPIRSIPRSFVMKFSSSLKFNAVSDWWDDYISYDTLKKHIYQLEKQQHGHERLHVDVDVEAGEHTSLLEDGGSLSGTDAVFVPLLDRELKKIELFYEHQLKELVEDLQDLEKDIALQDEIGLQGGTYYDDYDGASDDGDGDDESISRSPDARRRSLSRQRKSSSAGRRTSSHVERRQSMSSIDELEDHPPRAKGTLGKIMTNLVDSFVSTAGSSNDPSGSSGPATVWTAGTHYAYDTRLLYKRRISTLYNSFTNLKAFVEINYSGFRKITKKYDKVCFAELKDRYLHTVLEHAPPFTQAAKDELNAHIAVLVDFYAKCVTSGDKTVAKTQLRLHQREMIAWERDTVWRQMIGRERRGEDVSDDGAGATLIQEPKAPLFDIKTPLGHIRLTKRNLWKMIAAAVLVLFTNIQVVEGKEANRCFAILMFCTVLWASEAIPLFATSMFVPLLLVLFRVVRNADGVAMSTADATKYVFSIMFSPTIMLLIGGFTISSALSKTNIDRVLITRVLSLAGTRPRTVLLTFMGVSCFASMWISNVAAPTLCFTLIRPILRTLPPKSSFAPCLILAIALAANIGGQSSPISSPQNLIALDAMVNPKVDWASWFAVALPVSALSIFLIWLLLLVSYQPSRSPDGEGEIEIKPIRPTREPFTLKQYWVTFVSLVTIALWCIESKIQEYVGDMGVIALIPVVAFFSTGVLKKDDFEKFMWTIVFLAMGGIALGKGVMSSGLLEILDVIIRDLVEGFQLYTVVLILSPIILIISTFISHTIASVLLVPIAKTVGDNLGGHANLLIFITALICSAGMGMPVSGFPNQTAATQDDEMGELYLSNVDFLKNGIPASIIATLVVSTLGFVLMKIIGL